MFCFENGLLTLTFPVSAKVSKQMCESNDRLEQLGSVLSERLGTGVTLKLEIASDEEAPAKFPVKETKTVSQKRNEIINDPAVKTVLMELGATITGIEENQCN